MRNVPSFLAAVSLVCGVAHVAGAAEPIDIGSRRELFVDDFLIESMAGTAHLELHHPIPREIVIVHDAPWEGSWCGFHTVFQDGDVYKMYYRGAQASVEGAKFGRAHEWVACLATSQDGIQWTKPELGHLEFDGSKKNNIVWVGQPAAHDFTPFKDTNPTCPPAALYKSVTTAGMHKGALAFASPDGIRYKLVYYDGLKDQPEQRRWELYDVAQDPQETRNLYGDSKYGEMTATLKERLRDLRTKLGDPP